MNAKPKIIDNDDQLLYKELSKLIEDSQQKLSIQLNSTLTSLFWHIGYRINQNILHFKRADYGKQIVVTLSRKLTEKYGRNFEEKNLRRMLQFAEQFNDEQIVVTLSRQLSWSHILEVIGLPLLRLSTDGHHEETRIIESLSAAMGFPKHADSIQI